MIEYSYRTWETMTPLYPVEETTYYRIFEDEEEAEQNINPIWNGVVLPGYKLSNLENILCQYVRPSKPENLFNYYVFTDDQLRKTFYIGISNDNINFSIEYSITVIYDWSYTSNSSDVLTTLTPMVLDPRQFFFVSAYNHSGSCNMSIIKNGQQLMWYSCPVGDFKHGEIDLYEYGCKDGDTVRVVYTYGSGSTIYDFQVKSTCNNYCFYYINERGGWDTYAIRGKGIQKDKLNNYTYKQNYVNELQRTGVTPFFNFGTTLYAKDIKETWECSTGWINEDDSKRITSLLNSPLVFLHDFENDIVTPVIVTNSFSEHKTHRNQNRKLIQYTINVESSQEKYRM